MSQYRRLPAPSFRDKEIPPKDWMPTPEAPRVFNLALKPPAKVFRVLRCDRELFIAGYMPDGYPMKQYKISFHAMPMVILADSPEDALTHAKAFYPTFFGRLAVERIA